MTLAAPLPLSIPVLRTERLVLRAPQMSDLPAFTAFLQSDRAVFVGGGAHRTAFDCARSFGHLAGGWVLRGFGPHVWCLADGTPIGHGGPWFPALWPEPELGWCLWDAAHEGQGFATEAMQALLPWAMSLPGLASPVSYIDPGNAASIRLAERLGARLDPGATPPDDDPVLIFRHGTAA
jgi:RimJ/RimL family protein N-acetyltransferase